TAEVKSESWIEAGFEEIARSGVEGVRVEVLAKSLGVTKGGFYRRFRDRAALLEAMLRHWSEGRIAAIEKHTSLDGASARERLKGGEAGRNMAAGMVVAAETSGRARVGCWSGRALQLLGAFAVIAAAFLYPLQAAIAVAGLVGIVLVHACVHARLAGGLLGIF